MSIILVLNVQPSNIKCVVKSNVAYAVKPNIPPYNIEFLIILDTIDDVNVLFALFVDDNYIFIRGNTSTTIPRVKATYTATAE